MDVDDSAPFCNGVHVVHNSVGLLHKHVVCVV